MDITAPEPVMEPAAAIVAIDGGGGDSSLPKTQDESTEGTTAALEPVTSMEEDGAGKEAVEALIAAEAAAPPETSTSATMAPAAPGVDLSGLSEEQLQERVLRQGTPYLLSLYMNSI